MSGSTIPEGPAPAPSGGNARLLAARSIVDAFFLAVEEHPTRSALRRRVGDRWEVITWEDYGRAVSEAAAGLVEIGLRPGERVGILSANRPEWHQADLAALAAGGVSVPLYQTLTPTQVGYVLGHCEARVCVVENEAQKAKVLEVLPDLPALQRVVVMEGDASEDGRVITLQHLRVLGASRLEKEPAAVDDRRGAIKGEDLCSLVYTSGTTGPPKGTMITHGNIMWTLGSILGVITLTADDRFLSYLPLSHVAERTVSHFGQIVSGGETWFARSVQTLAEDLPACRPTIFFGVPRVWQKFHQKVTEHVQATGGPQGWLARTYLGMAEQVGDQRPGPLPFQLLDKVVGAKIRAQLGLDKARILITAAAPIHPSLVRWFHGIGLPVLEVYGQTEDCGPTTINPPGRARIGSVGVAFPGVELRLDDDGEILVKGGNVCRGYYQDPDGTKALLDDEGWMHSGDVGRLDDEGYLFITDRKKDLIINAAGKNISPQELETRLKVEELISQAVVIGEGRRYLVALLTLEPDALALWARQRGKTGEAETLVDDPDLQAAVAASVERVNAEHAPVEQIKRWRILPRDLTMDSDELTPTLKVKRKTVNQRYADVIEELYA